MKRADKFRNVCCYLFETYDLISPTMILNRLVEVKEDFVIREVRYCIKSMRKSYPHFMHIGGWEFPLNRKGTLVHIPEALYKAGSGTDLPVPDEMTEKIRSFREARVSAKAAPSSYPSHSRIPVGTGEFSLQDIWGSVVAQTDTEL